MTHYPVNRADGRDNSYYQRRLAAWDGVLRCILRLRDAPARP
jgi:hypothetical protein